MFGTNIRYLREKNGLRQRELAAQFGISKSAVSLWERNAVIPKMSTCIRIANYFNVNIEDLLNTNLQQQASNPKENIPNDCVKIYVYSDIPKKIPAHIPRDTMCGEISREISIPKSWQNGGRKYFGIIIKDNTMSPSFEEGDIVIIREQHFSDDGDICLVRTKDELSLYRAYYHNIDILIPLNNTETPIFSTKEDDGDDYYIHGIAVQLRRGIKTGVFY